MSQIQSLLESAGAGWKNMQSDAAKLAGKWEKTGLLEGLKNETSKNNMSVILENQAKQLVVETSQTGTGGTFTAGAGEEWAGIALPLVRKVFGQIAAQEFVSVQPMNLPSGLVFYLDFQYGTAKAPFAANGSMYGTGSDNFGNLAEGGLYGAGRFTYSVNDADSAAGAPAAVASASYAEVNFDANLSASVAAGEIAKLSIAKSGLAGADLAGLRGFIVSSSDVAAADNLNALAVENGNNIDFFVTQSAGQAHGATTFVQFQKQPADNSRGDFEGTSVSIPEVNIGMESEAIVAKTRKLKAVWTPEFAQDLNAYQALDAEAEVTNIMSEYISLEIDLEILDMLITDAAAGTEVWNVENNKAYSGAGNNPGDTDLGFYNSQGQWFQTLGTKINKLSNVIHQRTLRGGANFMVVSPTVATILESIPGFAADNSDAEKMEYAFGVQKAGALNGRYKVYKNPYMTENVMLLGFRGNQFLEAGAVFAPYIPLIMTPLVYDPDTFVPRKGLLTRYAKKMLRPEFYGKIEIAGLNLL